MEGKPLHYDGSAPVSGELSEYQPVEFTDEMRKQISANPYTHHVNETE
ncbi:MULTISPECIES: hypothetical protein [Pontibacillus]|uniref:Uncharacterized protein n=1 Tax=Pontibacillus chungwhensis TaxID=265426 RepID=A0ABY8UVJ0_9BACI|nr:MULTISPECIES: hypothetical protein [Pontibacillus]MCD5325077.1 hypothetical protein [Pontibacillus sp. HN14]WIF97328.1 hypothetical protein QNI29_16570 [Pontibacillus chungwhensis]